MIKFKDHKSSWPYSMKELISNFPFLGCTLVASGGITDRNPELSYVEHKE